MPVTRNPSPSQARKLETLELERGRMSVIGSDLFRSLRALKNNIKEDEDHRGINSYLEPWVITDDAI